MNILVTGANGFIGKHLCAFLSEQGHSVFKVVRRAQDILSRTSWLDLTDYNQVRNYLDQFCLEESIDVLIHLAARMVNEHQEEEGQFNVLMDNLAITKSVLMISKRLRVKKLINISSMAVYPNMDGVFAEESQIRMSVNSECMYGLGKFCSENILDYMLKDQNIVVSHLRVAQVYGDGMREDRIISIMKSELKEKNTITVFGAGERLSNFIHIHKLLGILNCFLINDYEGIYNVGDESLSYMDLAKKIINDYGNKSSQIIKKEKGSRSKFILDLSKMKSLTDL